MNNQQSVIVNFNPHFANGDASDFTQPFNKQLEIPENSEVAFYQGQLQRKTIVIPETEVITINFVEQLPSDAFRADVADGTNAKIVGANIPAKLSSETITVKKGSYTQSEFVEAVRAELQDIVAVNFNNNYQNTTGVDFLYQAVGENDEQGVFLGFAINNTPAGISRVDDVGSEVTLSLNATFAPEDRQTLFMTARQDNWNTFVTFQAPINPLGAVQNSMQPKMESQQNVFFYDINFEPDPVNQRIYVGWLNSAFQSNVFADTNTPELQVAYPDYPVKADGIPSSFFGIQYECETNASNVSTVTGKVYSNDFFVNQEQYDKGFVTDVIEGIPKGDYAPNDMNREMQRIFQFEVTGNFVPRQGWRIYSISEKTGIADPTGLTTLELRNYYFQILSKTYNDNGLYGYKGGENVLFDSKDFGISIPQELVEQGAALQSYVSDRDPAQQQFLGIQPYVFMRNANPNTYVYNPTMTGIQQNLDLANGLMFNQPVVRYNFEFPIGSVVRDIFGTGRSYQDITKFSTEEARFDPNIYPQSRGRQAGINALYSDNIRYNIEVDSLPIRTFNSTKNPNNVSGNERTILHSTESFIEGEVTELTNSFLNKNVVPSNLKYISLNNKQRILLNDINIKVTRANTNVTADEITDCSFEMLIRNKSNN